MTTTVFVYGSLKRGFSNHYLLEGSRFVGEATSVEHGFCMWGWGFPFLAPIEDGAAVRGEVYEVDANTLKHLDRLEGHPKFYRREERRFACDDGQQRTAWVYLVPATIASNPRSLPGYRGAVVAPIDGVLKWLKPV